MRWNEGGGPSSDLEDRRGRGGGFGGGIALGRLGIGGFLVLLVLSIVFKRDFFALLDGGSGESAPSTAAPAGPEEERMVKFVSFVLDDIQDTWTRELPKMAEGRSYERAKLVLFTGATPSACGRGEAAMGPFYCPGDHKAYIDLAFYKELKTRFGAPGDFAQAYVLAHEIGHHVQNLLGVEAKVRRLQKSGDANAMSVRMELQADCFAGIWGHSTAKRNILEPDDVGEAMKAAESIGDDTLQKQAGGRVRPEKFTHGSAAQRMKWFRRGFDQGMLAACDTFGLEP